MQQRQVGIWAAAGLVLYLALGAATLFVLAWLEHLTSPAGIETGAGTVGLSARNGLHAVVWGLSVAGVSLPVARRLGVAVAVSRAGVLILLAGLALAAVTTFLVEEFVRARYGMFEPRATGWSLFAGPALVALAAAGWATLSVSPGDRGVLRLCSLSAAVACAIALLPSIPGALDGIGPGSVPLAAAFAADVSFVVVAVAASIVSRPRPAVISVADRADTVSGR